MTLKVLNISAAPKSSSLKELNIIHAYLMLKSISQQSKRMLFWTKHEIISKFIFYTAITFILLLEDSLQVFILIFNLRSRVRTSGVLWSMHLSCELCIKSSVCFLCVKVP